MGALTGKKAVVTGSSRGIGAGIARSLAEAGADVMITYRRKAKEAEELAGELRALGVRAGVVACDVGDLESTERCFAEAAEFLGGIDSVVANAGIPSGIEPVEELEPKYWHKVLDTNLTGAFHTLRTAIPHLRRAGGGSITTISSIAAQLLAPRGVAYNVAKAGVNALTLTTAREVAKDNIRVNVVAPGLIDTEMGQMVVRIQGDNAFSSIPLGRIGQPRDIGAAVAHLASDAGSWITGQILRVDGGACIQP